MKQFKYKFYCLNCTCAEYCPLSRSNDLLFISSLCSSWTWLWLKASIRSWTHASSEQYYQYLLQKQGPYFGQTTVKPYFGNIFSIILYYKYIISILLIYCLHSVGKICFLNLFDYIFSLFAQASVTSITPQDSPDCGHSVILWIHILLCKVFRILIYVLV